MEIQAFSCAKMSAILLSINLLTHWSRETHMYVGKLAIIIADNGLSPGRRQAISEPMQEHC